MKFTDLIVEYPNVLSDELCDEIIERFEVDDRTHDGLTNGGLDKETKDSEDLIISQFSDWDDIDERLFNAVTPYVTKYSDFLYDFNKRPLVNIMDTGYQTQKTVPGGKYIWHNDASIKVNTMDMAINDRGYINARERYATYIFYLNDVDKENGGATQFYFGKEYSYHPTKGKLLMFPATNLYTHCGQTLTGGVKYLVTGWLWSDSGVKDRGYPN